MKKSLEIKIKEFFGIQKNSRELESEIRSYLGIQKKGFSNCKTSVIEKIDIENNSMNLKLENRRIESIELDNFTLQNLQNGISNVKFKHIYGTDYRYELSFYGFSISKIENARFYCRLKTKLNENNQTSRKRERMYNKQIIECSKTFLKKLIEKTCYNNI